MNRCPFFHLALVLGLLLYCGGCAERIPPHTQIFVPTKHIRIWSYSPISTTQIDGIVTDQKGFVKLTVPGKDATIVLQNGSNIHITDRVTINGTNIPTTATVRINKSTLTTCTLQVFVGAKGEVEFDRSIRTYK